MMQKMLPIPISAAKLISTAYGYDQVIIIARRVGEAPDDHGEHVTTYGSDRANCDVAAKIGKHITSKIMMWPEDSKLEVEEKIG
jgi:hypothetical protein